MSFSINTGDLPRISSYEQAQNWFNKAHNPVRSKKWSSNQRPLRNTRSTHLRIEHHLVNGVDCYDMCLYQTPLIRFFQPNEQGERAVWMQNHYSNSSANFMWTMGWYNRMDLQTTEGVEFPLFVSDQSQVAVDLWDDPFTCKVVLNSEGKVIANKSAYIPAMRKSSSATHRAKRKALREHMSMVFDMLEMQYQAFISDITVNTREGDPFKKRDQASLPDGLRSRLHYTGVDDLTPDDMTHIMQYASATCHAVAQSILNRRAYAFEYPKFDMSPYDGDWEIRRQGYAMRDKCEAELRSKGEAPCDDQPINHHTPELQAYLTPTWDDIKRAVDMEFQHLVGLKDGDAYMPYQMFAPDLAQRVWAVKYRHGEDLPRVLGEDVYCKLVNRKGVVY